MSARIATSAIGLTLVVLPAACQQPDSTKGSFFCHCSQVVKVKRPVGLDLPPSSHWGQRTSVTFGLRSASGSSC